MKIFIVTHEQLNGEVELRYDPDGFLFRIERRAEMKPETAGKLWANAPLTPAHFGEWKTRGFQFLQIAEDLSFEAFWKAWLRAGGDVGNKGRANTIWQKMPDRIKSQVLWSLPAYGRYIARNPWYKPQWVDTYIGSLNKSYLNDWDSMGDNAPKKPKRDTL